MGSIRKRERDNGTIFYEVRVSAVGKKQVSKSFPTMKEANSWMVEAEKVNKQAKTRTEADVHKITLAKVIDDYITTKTEEQNNPISLIQTKLKNELNPVKIYNLDIIKDKLGELTVFKVNRNVVQSFLFELGDAAIPIPANKKKGNHHKLYNGEENEKNPKTYSPSTVRKYYYALKTAMEWHAARYNYDLGNTFLKINVPGAWEESRERRLEKGEEEKLLEACDGMYKDPEGWKLFIRLCLETGMRSQEILFLTWDETSLENRTISIGKMRVKTRTARQIPLSSKAVSILTQLAECKNPKDDRVFHKLPKTTGQVAVGFKRITTRANIKNLRIHDLRHEATSRFFENTQLSLTEIAMITGHSDFKTLNRYTHLRPSFLVDKLN